MANIRTTAHFGVSSEFDDMNDVKAVNASDEMMASTSPAAYSRTQSSAYGTEQAGYAQRGQRAYRSYRSSNRSRYGKQAQQSQAGVGTFTRAKAQDPHDADACREAALRILDASARSSVSIAKKLSERGYDSVVIAQVVARLIDVYVIDDEAYAASVVRSCVNRRMGARGAMQTLRTKDVPTDVATRAVHDAQTQGMFEDAAWDLGRVVARKTSGLDHQVRLRRFWSAGARKGHDMETLRRVAQTVFADRSDEDNE